MNKATLQNFVRSHRLPRETVAILLVVAFLIGLPFYVYNGIKKYDDQKVRFMVTTDDERKEEKKGDLITPSVEQRMAYTLRDYPITMAFIIITFLLLSLWNYLKSAHMQAFLCALFMLLGIGCSQKVLYAGFYGLTGEAGFIMFGCIAMIATFFLWRALGQKLNKWAYIGLSGCILLMLGLNMLPILRDEAINNSYNWVSLFGLTFQPSEFIKAGLIILGACSFDNRRRRIWYFTLLLLSCGVVAAARDIGALFVLALLFVTMVYLIFDDKRLMVVVLLVGVVAFSLLVATSHTARERMDALGHAMTSDRHQQRDFISAIVRAGWGGLGMKNASEFYFLFAGGTDGVMAGIQAIFGLPMLIVVIFCYMTLIMQCGVNRSLYPTSQPILFQMGVFITAQILLNYGGSLDVIPFTGITAPFLSTGGSSTLLTMMLIGVMAASLYNKPNFITHKEEDHYET